MIYPILKQFFRIALSVFFRKVDIVGKENFKKKGPVIFVANHPSAVIDPLIIATFLSGELYYLAAAEWFGKGFKSRFFKNQFNMIPVYRPWVDKSENKSNKSMFEDSSNSLALGNRILVFPEGTSVTGSEILPLKTGTARIKIDFEATLSKTDELQIIPIGLNYASPHDFQSQVKIVIGSPIQFNTEKIKQSIDESDPQSEAKLLTDIIQKAMGKTMGNNENEIQKTSIKSKLIQWLILSLGFPLFLISFIYFIVPLLLSKSIFNRFLNPKIDTEYQSEKLNPSFRGSLLFLSGTAIFLIWIILLSIILGLLFKSWLIFIGAILLSYPVLRFGLFYKFFFKDTVGNY